MKLIFALFALALSASAQTAPLIGTDGGYQASFTSPGVACPASGGTSCVAGFTLVVTPPFGPAVTFPPCSATVTGNCLGPASTSFTYRPATGIYCGSWSATVAVNWLDNLGNPVTSVAVSAPPVTEPCPFVASPASSVTGKPVK